MGQLIKMAKNRDFFKDLIFMINYIKVIVQYLYVHNAWEISVFLNQTLKILLVRNLFLSGSGSVTYFFTSWIRIRIKIYGTDPQHWYSGTLTLVP